MKKILFIFALSFCAATSIAQSEMFDIATFKSPKSWKKESLASAVQFSSQNVTTSAYGITKADIERLIRSNEKKISIHNHTPIETTAYYQHHIKN